MLLGFCQDTRAIWVFAGKVVTIFKIFIPAILVIIGVVGLGKAILADDDKEIKKEVTSLIKKVIIAICIFFIPTIVSAIFSFAIGNDIDQDYKVCIEAIAKGK